MGFFSSLVDAFRSSPRTRESIPLGSPRRNRQVLEESNSGIHGGYASSKTVVSGPATDRSDSTYAAIKRKSMSRRRSWFAGKADADDDVPAVPSLVRTDYNRQSGIKSPTLGRSSRANGADYYQIPEDRRDQRTSAFSHRQNATTVGALPPLPSIPIITTYDPKAATSTLPAEKRRGRTVSMKSTHQRSNSQASTKSKRRSRSFWASSNPDDDEDVPPIPDLAAITTPDFIDHDPIVSSLKRTQSRRRARSSTHGDGARESRPVSTASRRSYTPKSAAAGFLKSTNGASEDQRKSYRRSFNLGEGVELVCMTDEHRVEWEKLMNKNAQLEDSLFASMAKNSDEEQIRDRHSNAQALAALEFGVRA